jgi:hypothetical protein
MAQNISVPDSHKQIPKAPEDRANNDIGDPSLPEIMPAVALPQNEAKQKAALARKAHSHLARRNRRANRLEVTMPLTCELEAGTRVNCTGFSERMGADGIWTIELVEIRISGKGGCTTRVSCHIEPEIDTSSTSMMTALQKDAARAKSLKPADKPVDAPASMSPTPLSVQLGKPQE